MPRSSSRSCRPHEGIYPRGSLATADRAYLALWVTIFLAMSPVPHKDTAIIVANDDPVIDICIFGRASFGAELRTFPKLANQ